MVGCPRGCAAQVERGSLKGHLSGRCDREIITCECGQECSRGEQREVLETIPAEQEEEENGAGLENCIHTYRQCKSCETNIQRLHWKVCIPLDIIASDKYSPTSNPVQTNNRPVPTAIPCTPTPPCKNTSTPALCIQSRVPTPASAVPQPPSPAPTCNHTSQPVHSRPSPRSSIPSYPACPTWKPSRLRHRTRKSTA